MYVYFFAHICMHVRNHIHLVYVIFHVYVYVCVEIHVHRRQILSYDHVDLFTRCYMRILKGMYAWRCECAIYERSSERSYLASWCYVYVLNSIRIWHCECAIYE
jgi:hypothetical protein